MEAEAVRGITKAEEIAKPRARLARDEYLNVI